MIVTQLNWSHIFIRESCEKFIVMGWKNFHLVCYSKKEIMSEIFHFSVFYHCFTLLTSKTNKRKKIVVELHHCGGVVDIKKLLFSSLIDVEHNYWLGRERGWKSTIRNICSHYLHHFTAQLISNQIFSWLCMQHHDKNSS